jgi:excisionase family DNA binding protein
MEPEMSNNRPQTDYHVGQVARIVGVAPSTVHEAIRKGRLRAWHTPKGHNRIPVDALADFLGSLGRDIALPAPTWRQP